MADGIVRGHQFQFCAVSLTNDEAAGRGSSNEPLTRGSKYQIFAVSGSEHHSLNGVCGWSP